MHDKIIVQYEPKMKNNKQIFESLPLVISLARS